MLWKRNERYRAHVEKPVAVTRVAAIQKLVMPVIAEAVGNQLESTKEMASRLDVYSFVPHSPSLTVLRWLLWNLCLSMLAILDVYKWGESLRASVFGVLSRGFCCATG